jgi:hypothetical protein
VLPLASPSFLVSDYCYDIEMQRALEKHEAGTACVIPVILHPCDWQHALFGKLRATPPDGKSISTFTNQHEAFLFPQLLHTLDYIPNQDAHCGPSCDRLQRWED